MTRPALRGVVTGPAAVHRRRSFILVRKSNAPKGPETGLPRRRSFSEFSCEHSAWRLFRKHLPHVEKTPPEIGDPCVFTLPLPESGTQGRHGRDRGLPVVSTSLPGVGAGRACKCARLPLAASQVLCLPHPRVGKLVSPEILVCSKWVELVMTVWPLLSEFGA